jgi:dethiobiotin synthetase
MGRKVISPEARGWFIAGTDTGVGKTRAACALLTALVRSGRKAVGMKPVASGGRKTAAGLRCGDAEALLAAGAIAAEYTDVNPYCFEPAVAPHLAASATGVEIDLREIASRFHKLRRLTEWIVVEGAGGWLTPINARESMADVAAWLQLPVILVVGMRLGCLNHALLTQRAIRAAGLPLAGWVANRIDPAMSRVNENVAALQSRIAAPLLAVFPHATSGNGRPAAEFIDLEKLVKAAMNSG